ncbi:PUA-like protein [Viridothelium virens]|uniref:PUA-like protein n=1 Tax=Viridothelium virens TaxID=1048519 RepID=A0A6A6GYP6_VIRVR|nr:PUA-like protein [Viridothelium virens]
MSRFPLEGPEIVAFMKSVSQYLGREFPKPKDVFDFGEDKPHVSDELLSLAIQGKKTATTSWPVPSPRHWDVGDLSIILNGAGKPSALMRTTELKTCKFRDVDEDFGLAEGEGTFEQYRKNHFYWYGRYGERNGEVFGEDSVVLCERFEILYPSKPGEEHTVDNKE